MTETAVKKTSSRIVLKEDDLRRMWPRAKSAYINALVEKQDVLVKYGILDNAERWCMAAGNFDAETGGLTVIAENMSYSAKRMREVWPSRFRGVRGWNKARRLAHNPRGLANEVYGGRMGNRRGTDDGYDYRGRGLLQITGREMYQDMADRLKSNLIESSERVLDSDILLGIVGETWTARTTDLNKLADQGHYRKICNAINRGSPNSKYNPIGWSHRQQGLRKARKIWGDSAEEKRFEGMLREGDTGYRVLKMQERLLELGYNSLGRADRDFGDNTATALSNFQRVNNLDADAIFGPKTQAVLESDDALPKPHNAERIEATVEDVKATGSKTIQATQNGKGLVKAVTAGGVLALIEKLASQIQSIRNAIEPLQSQVSWMAEYWPAGLLVVAWLTWNYFDTAETARVKDHATGKNMGR